MKSVATSLALIAATFSFAAMAQGTKTMDGALTDAKGMTLYTFDKDTRWEERLQRTLRSQLASANGHRDRQSLPVTTRSLPVTTGRSSGRTRASRCICG